MNMCYKASQPLKCKTKPNPGRQAKPGEPKCTDARSAPHLRRRRPPLQPPHHRRSSLLPGLPPRSPPNPRPRRRPRLIRQPGLRHQPPRRRGARLPRLRAKGVRRRARTRCLHVEHPPPRARPLPIARRRRPRPLQADARRGRRAGPLHLPHRAPGLRGWARAVAWAGGARRRGAVRAGGGWVRAQRSHRDVLPGRSGGGCRAGLCGEQCFFPDGRVVDGHGCWGQEWLDAGEMVHGFVIKLGFDANIPLVNALIAMYGKCGSIAMAEALFEGMTAGSLVSWNTMVAMYEQHGDAVEAIKFFRRMLIEKVGFDCVTLVSVLSACARSGALDTGKWVHEFARNHGLDADARVGNVLVDMYAKCGEISNAREVFDSLNVRGVVPWSAMISAYANHGESAEALKLFSLMKSEGVRPNSFTFTAVLVACGHSGLVDEGLKHFNSILTDYQMSPTLEHYACMVDMLGRAGRLVEAYEIIRGMSMCPDKCVWGAFLGGCRLHGNLELAEFVAKDLFQSGSNDVTFYVLMSNLYFEAGMLEDAERMRRAMKDMELKKTAGRSAVSQ
ncbi:hypothetical protein PVAP13_8NG202602 [Panicum virgatum]|uniref:Pentatricopeptide repeat-containing protein n=1 Tax=Panicum virgatum TaxID=38727 RepID=A0A8T0PDI8_PANVG|nr:hypothetical protein PVAP13_8NG202602 [Panicum virgatum]